MTDTPKYAYLPGASGNYLPTPPPVPESDLVIDVRDVRVTLTAEYLEIAFREHGTYQLYARHVFVPPLAVGKPTAAKTPGKSE